MGTDQIKPSIYEWMYNRDTEILFPPRVIPSLRNLRGTLWHDLVDGFAKSDSLDPERCAFVLFMARLCGCISCSADSYRAMRGCTDCSIQTVRRFHGSDSDLLDLFVKARQEIEEYLCEKDFIQMDGLRNLLEEGFYG
jgi:hypothetical protein